MTSFRPEAFGFVPEEERRKFKDMGPKQVFQELVDDAVAGHATALFRFSPAIKYLSKKWRMHPENVFLKFVEEVKVHRPIGPPVEPPMELQEILTQGGFRQ